MLVSIIIPTFNCQTWLPHSIKSAMDQTHKDLEILIVDDGSTDRTDQYLRYLAKLDDKRVRVISLPNGGRSAARNAGNLAALGEVIFVLDADDLASPNRVELTLKKFKDGVEFVYGSATVIDCVGRKLGETRAEVFNKEKALETLQNRIVHSSVAYTKAFAMTNPYSLGELSSLGLDDWAMQIGAALSSVKMDFVPQTICAYRILESGITSTRNEAKVLEAKKKYLDSLKVLTA